LAYDNTNALSSLRIIQVRVRIESERQREIERTSKRASERWNI